MRKAIITLAAAAAMAVSAGAQSSLQSANKKNPDALNSQGLPAPIQGKTFTLGDIEKDRSSLVGKVVWVKLQPTGRTQDAGSEYEVWVEDAKEWKTAYVFFPKSAVKNVDQFNKKAAMSFFLKIEPSKLIAVGRSKKVDSFGNFTYVW